VIDLGPEGGVGGGRIIAEGTPEEVAHFDQSATGRFLAHMQTQIGQPIRSEAV
jgi:excinuclease ABC subunit A